MLISLVVVSLLLLVSLYYNFKFATQIIKIVDSLEQSLDVLDERYVSISKILTIPIFYDSPEIRKVVQDIKESRDSILKVANQIASIEETTEEDPKNEN
jgi:predicted PurR-regulated permease PerM